LNAAYASETQYTLPKNIAWIPSVTKGVPGRFFYAYLRGKAGDKCGQLMRIKFPDRFVYPWHVNELYGISTVLQGTLVLGFDKHHLASAERTLPAGSVVQGLATEPHYGRAIGETIFDAYMPCGVR
jgi:quercetin dioxygenase-like cupin family protein